jgi:hypothetical protein
MSIRFLRRVKNPSGGSRNRSKSRFRIQGQSLLYQKSCSYRELKNIPFLIDARSFFTAFRLGFGEYNGLLKNVARMTLVLRLSLVERLNYSGIIFVWFNTRNIIGE